MSTLLVVLAAGRKYFDQRRPFALRDVRSDQIVRFDGGDGVAKRKIKSTGQFIDRLLDVARAGDPLRDEIALADRFRDHLLEGGVGGGSDGNFKRLAEQTVGRRRALQQHDKCQLVEQLRGGGLIEHLEACCDVGLERELVQQARAEGVDGLHLQPARRFQRSREKPARASAL